MSDQRVVQLTVASGAFVVASMVLAIAAFPSSLPAAAASPDALTRIFAIDRSTVLLSMYLTGLGWGAAYLVFLVALRHQLQTRAPETELSATIGVAGGISQSICILLFALFFTLASLRAGGQLEPTVVQLLSDGAALSNNVSGFGTALCLGAFTTAFRRAGGFPGWLLWLGWAVVAIHLVSAGTFAESGPLSPTGVPSSLAPFGTTLWVACVSIVSWRR